MVGDREQGPFQERREVAAPGHGDTFGTRAAVVADVRREAGSERLHSGARRRP